MGLQPAVHLGHMPWALTKEEEEEEGNITSQGLDLPVFKHASKIYFDTIDDGKVHKVDEFCYYTPLSEH
jgi:hypothetical protein